MSDYIQPLKALLEIAISQLGKPRVERAKFEKTIVEPLNDTFEKMYSHHMATFKKVRALIVASKPPEEINSFVHDTILSEQNVTELLYNFTRRDHPWRHVPCGGELNEAFIDYLASIAGCLRSPRHDSTTLIYYASLDDLAEDLPNVSREESMRRLDEIITRFQRFYADVKTNHLRLQRLCSL